VVSADAYVFLHLLMDDIGHCDVVRCHPVKEETSFWWAGTLWS